MRYFILPYKQGSVSAKRLAVALGGKVLKLQGSKYKSRNTDVVINWGNKNFYAAFESSNIFVLNDDVQVSDKLQFFETLAADGCSDIIPPWWTAMENIPDAAFPVVCRTLLNSHSGNGIVIASTRADLVQAPLYVKYIKKMDEYRVHVGGDGSRIIAVQQKRRKHDFNQPNYQIRNHQNGYIYAREGVNAPEAALVAAKAAFKVSGLDFGAFDVVYNRQRNKAYVLEVNTAPGLEGQTVNDYVSYFQTFWA